MRTFNVDPLSHARAWKEKEKLIVAPNGTSFSRKHGLLPALIAGYFATRRLALDSGDSIAAQVYKILMNSFYGVLGTSACRYGKSELAGAITSFARKWLLFSRDWFNSKGLRVLYGDTDSLFVKTGLNDSAPLAEFEKYCAELTKELNLIIAGIVRNEYDLESFIELRFEKAYRRFIIPPLRNFHASEDSDKADNSKTVRESRGRAKGYGGYLLHTDGKTTVEVKGMEAVRSDTTPLARRLQLELLELVFAGCTEQDFRERVDRTVCELRSGELDHELVYRKRLTRYPETYTSSTPPQVKAARALGWKKRRGTVEYLWTVNGPEPAALPHGIPDYDHYAESQVYPLVRSIAEAAGWDAGFFVTRKGGAFCDTQMQMELSFG
jgi:DNA polymerase-2